MQLIKEVFLWQCWGMPFGRMATARPFRDISGERYCKTSHCCGSDLKKKEYITQYFCKILVSGRYLIRMRSAYPPPNFLLIYHLQVYKCMCKLICITHFGKYYVIKIGWSLHTIWKLCHYTVKIIIFNVSEMEYSI